MEYPEKIYRHEGGNLFELTLIAAECPNEKYGIYLNRSTKKPERIYAGDITQDSLSKKAVLLQMLRSAEYEVNSIKTQINDLNESEK